MFSMLFLYIFVQWEKKAVNCRRWLVSWHMAKRLWCLVGADSELPNLCRASVIWPEETTQLRYGALHNTLSGHKTYARHFPFASIMMPALLWRLPASLCFLYMAACMWAEGGRLGDSETIIGRNLNN